MENQRDALQKSASFSSPKVALPDKYDGNMARFKDFKLSLENLFVLHSDRYASDMVKIRFIGTLLTKDALAWFRSLIDTQSSILNSYAQFMEEFKLAFDDPMAQRHAQSKIHRLKQDKGSVLSYTSKFRRIAVESGFNEEALMDSYYRGLSEEVKDVLSMGEDPKDLDDLISKASKIDNKLYERKLEKSNYRAVANNAPQRRLHVNQNVQPMDLDAIGQGSKKLTMDERFRRIKNKLCLYCGEPNHKIDTCPKKTKN